MKVIVMGAGIVGLTTAYALWRKGCEVTVIDRQPGPALETSFANAGGICPSFAGPWAAPGMPLKVLRLAFSDNAPIRFKPKLNRLQWQWLRQWLVQCNPQAFSNNKSRMQQIAQYSFDRLTQMRQELDFIEFDFKPGGVLQLLSTEQEMQVAKASTSVLDHYEINWKLYDAKQLLAIEPMLGQQSSSFMGALLLPKDAGGDCYKFCHALSQFLVDQGVKFHFNTEIKQLKAQGDTIVGVETSSGSFYADKYVVALGSFAPALVKALGIKLLIYPVKGYSITVPMQADLPDLQHTLMDENHKIMITQLGRRIRAAGMAELGAYTTDAEPKQIKRLCRVVERYFPTGLDWTQLQSWAGLRPMTPDGPPILGPTSVKNLYLNSGQGSNGWTQAAGCAQVVADTLVGEQPALSLDGFTYDRFN